jgi:hypothetical protein
MLLAQPRPWPDVKYKGVRGWLLFLCLMLTVIGPVISAWLMTNEYAAFAPYFAGARGLQAAVLISLLITACSVAFGVYAGLRMWLIRPKAVNTAKHALLFGLAADIVTTTTEVAAGQVAAGNDRLLYQIDVGLIPSLICFTLCFAYLNRSKRVYATYESHRTDA